VKDNGKENNWNRRAKRKGSVKISWGTDAQKDRGGLRERKGRYGGVFMVTKGIQVSRTGVNLAEQKKGSRNKWNKGERERRERRGITQN